MISLGFMHHSQTIRGQQQTTSPVSVAPLIQPKLVVEHPAGRFAVAARITTLVHHHPRSRQPVNPSRSQKHGDRLSFSAKAAGKDHGIRLQHAGTPTDALVCMMCAMAALFPAQLPHRFSNPTSSLSEGLVRHR